MGWLPKVEGLIAILNGIEQGREQVGRKEYGKRIYGLNDEETGAPVEVVSSNARVRPSIRSDKLTSLMHVQLRDAHIACCQPSEGP